MPVSKQHLMESKHQLDKMVNLRYTQDPEGNQNVEVEIKSLTLVGSIPYLIELGLFFQPDESMIDFWRKESFGDLADTLGKHLR